MTTTLETLTDFVNDKASLERLEAKLNMSDFDSGFEQFCEFEATAHEIVVSIYYKPEFDYEDFREWKKDYIANAKRQRNVDAGEIHYEEAQSIAHAANAVWLAFMNIKVSDVFRADAYYFLNALSEVSGLSLLEVQKVLNIKGGMHSSECDPSLEYFSMYDFLDSWE